MRRIGPGIRQTIAAVAFAAATAMPAMAEDGVRLFDTSDLNIYKRSSDVQINLSDTAIALNENLNGIDGLNTGPRITLTPPKPTKTGFTLGVEVSLDEDDHVQLKDQQKLYFEGSFGRMDMFETLAAQSCTGHLPSIFDDNASANSLSILSRASSLNVDALQLTLATSNPGLLTPHYAGVKVGYSAGSGDRIVIDPRDKGFEISLTSMIMTQGSDRNSLSFLNAVGLGSDERAYNLGLNVGYRGFSLMASFLHGEDDINSSYQSYDVGLEYAFGSWATSLAVGGYFNDAPTVSYANLFDIDRIYSVEIGASYMLRPWLKLQGRFQFFDYRTLVASPLDGLGGTFFLGTSLGF